MEICIIEGAVFSCSFTVAVPVACKLLIMWNVPGDSHPTKLLGDVQTPFLPHLRDILFFES